MSVAAISWAFEQKLPPAEKIVLIALADCENAGTHACFPGQATLVDMSSLSESTVRRTLRKLEDRSLIRRERRSTSAGYRTSDSYILAFREEFEEGGEDLPVNVTGRDFGDEPTGQIGSTYRSTVTGTGEPEEEPEDTPPTPSVDDGFDVVWAAWPKKDGKLVAQRRWRSLSKKRRTEILPSLLAHAEAHAKHTPPQFRPRLSTWIGEERWSDELPQPRDARATPGVPQSVAPAVASVPPGMILVWDENGKPVYVRPGNE